MPCVPINLITKTAFPSGKKTLVIFVHFHIQCSLCTPRQLDQGQQEKRNLSCWVPVLPCKWSSNRSQKEKGLMRS